MYRPPNTNASEFITDYGSQLCKLKQVKCRNIVIGLDHNLDFIKSGHHESTYQFIKTNLDLFV